MGNKHHRERELPISRGAESCCDRHHGKTRVSRVAAALQRRVVGAPADAAALWLLSLKRNLQAAILLSDFFRSCVPASDAALHRAARQTVQAESARGLASAVKPGDDFAIQVDHLAFPINPET